MRTLLLTGFALSMLCAPGAARADVDIRIGSGSGCSPAGTNIQAAINAADPALGVTNVLIARNATYSAQQLDVNGKNVRLVGGYANCLQAQPDSARTLISGAGGGSNSVITIRGSTGVVALRNLDITGGDEVTTTLGFGGGIDISGGPHALVYLENVRIQNSRAGFGGGISIKNATPSNQAAVRLVLARDNLITLNSVDHGGGGIYCEDSTIEMVGSNNSIHQNSAGTGTNGAQGGGVRLQNCIMRIASRSPIFGSVQSNTASGPGGGISITGERARLTLFNLLPGEPTSIALNTAGGVGGGIDIGSSAKVFGYDIIIDGNVSRSGGGGVATFDNDDEPSSELVLQGNLGGAPAGAVNCVAALDCNRVSNNLARSMAGVDQPGAALRINGVGGGFGNVGLSIARLSGTRLNGNNGRNLVHAVDEKSEAYIDGALIDGNNASAELMHSPADGFLRLSGTTIAGNTIADAVIRTSSLRTVMQRSVVWQPGRPLYSLVSGSLSPNAVIYVLSNSLANAPPNTTNRIVNQFEIAFVDAAAGDYRPAAGSLAIDYAAASAVLEYTRDRFPRNVGIPQAPDQFGTQDAGAFEKQSAEGFNSTPSISVAGTLTMLEDGGEFFLQGFSLADPDGDIVGALYVTAPPGTGFIDGLYFAGVSATQLLPNRIVIEGPLSRITNDTATLAGVTRFFPAANVFGAVPIALELNDQGNTGIGTPLSAQATLTVDVLPVNDAPTLAIADIVRTAGMSGAQEQGLVPLSTFVPGPSNESSQTIERFVLAGFSDPGNILAAPPTLTPAGQLVFNLNGAVGVVLLDVYVEDSGGTDNGGQDRSAAARFSLRVVGEQLFSNGFE